MSELMNVSSRRKGFRWQLLTTVSALALLGSVYGTDKAKAADDNSDHPTIWIELGGQLERLGAGEQQFVPPFILATPRPSPETISPLSADHAPLYSFGGEGKISFEPDNTNWVFSASIRYGRSNSSKHVHQQSYPTKRIDPYISSGEAKKYQRVAQFMDTATQHSESHTILDFQAGKDIGVGLFGAGASSILSLGVRFAQFGSKTNVAFGSNPDGHPTFTQIYGFKVPKGAIYHTNAAKETATRGFRGLGPLISWNASAPIAGNLNDGQIILDWGANAAVLFGRQKAIVHHQTTAQYHKGKYAAGAAAYFRTTLYQHTPPDQHRSRTVTAPNVGGFAGLSYRIENAKVSIGYRADFFLGAMDGGIDTTKKENIGFYGPFATVSVGLP